MLRFLILFSSQNRLGSGRIIASKKYFGCSFADRGPAPTGKGTSLHVRLQPQELAMVDEWIAAQSKPMSRPEAIRQMLAERAAKPAKS